MFFELFADTVAKERGPELGPALMKWVSEVERRFKDERGLLWDRELEVWGCGL